ncbi:MAG: TRAP transporter small permease [Neomegalonema sp.]|nr:TRAP transporter small permease [Neomegalonema sp.]
MLNTSERAAFDAARAPFILKAIRAISELCGWIAAAMFSAAIFITCQMIFVRYVLNGSTVWQTEMITFLAVGATLIGLPYVQKHQGHVNVDVIPLVLRGRARKALAIFVLLISIAAVGAVAWYSAILWYDAWDWGETTNTPWDPPKWIPYLSLPLGFGLFALQLLGDLAALLLGYAKPFALDEENGEQSAPKNSTEPVEKLAKERA